MRKPHSFDIFDTLLARRCVEPKNVFHELEQRVRLHGFAEQRIRAERMVASGPYTLDDIYAVFHTHFGMEAEVVDYLKQMEIALEVENAIPIRENLDAVENGDVLITDMYLPRDAIMKLLDKIGLRKQVGLIISSSGKHSGQIWPGVHASLALEQHVGDNMHSDVRSPLDAGLFAEHLTTSNLSSHEQFLRNEGFEQLARVVREVRLTQLHSGLGREKVSQRLLQINNNIPILVLTSVVLKLLSKKTGVGKILFSSRDCYYFSRIFNALSDKAGWNVPSEYFYTSRLTRISPSESYLRYFKGIADGQSLVVDLCGTGWSLGELYRRAGFMPQTFLLHDLKNKPDLIATYDKLRKGDQIPTIALVSDASINNGCLEMANYVDSGMAIDVKDVPGCLSMLPVFEYPNYPASVVNAIGEIEAAHEGFRTVLERIDVGALTREIEGNLDRIEGVVTELYKDLCGNMSCMHDIAAYHARQDRKSMWKLTNAAR
jgi:hypothetical protein